MNLYKTLIAPALLIAAIAIAHGPNSDITADVKTQTVQELAKAMRESYAYPELGKKAASALEDHLKAHDYDGVSDGKEFAKRLSTDMNAICKDAHLNVRYSEDALPVRKDRGEP